MAGRPQRRAALLAAGKTPEEIGMGGNGSAWARAQSRTKLSAAELAKDLPSDEELHRQAKAVLLELAIGSGLDRDRVAAARALCDVTKPAQAKGDGGTLERELEKLPPEKLEELRKQAEKDLAESLALRPEGMQ